MKKLHIIFILIILILLISQISCSSKKSNKLSYYEVGNINIFISKSVDKNLSIDYVQNFKDIINKFFSKFQNNFDITNQKVVIFLVNKKYNEISKSDFGFIKSKVKDKSQLKYFNKFMNEILYEEEDRDSILIPRYNLAFIKCVEGKILSLRDSLYNGTILKLFNMLAFNNLPKSYQDYILRTYYNLYNKSKNYEVELREISFFRNTLIDCFLEYIAMTNDFSIDDKKFSYYLKNKIYNKALEYIKPKISIKDIKDLDYYLKFVDDNSYLPMYLGIMFPKFILEKYGIKYVYLFTKNLMFYKYDTVDDLVNYSINKDFKSLMKEFEDYLKNNF